MRPSGGEGKKEELQKYHYPSPLGGEGRREKLQKEAREPEMMKQHIYERQAQRWLTFNQRYVLKDFFRM